MKIQVSAIFLKYCHSKIFQEKTHIELQKNFLIKEKNKIISSAKQQKQDWIRLLVIVVALLPSKMPGT